MLRLLKRYFRLGVDEPAPADPPQADLPLDESALDAAEALIEPAESAEPAQSEPEEPTQVRQFRERAEAAERAAQEARTQAEQARQYAQQAQPQRGDPVWEEEERKLRDPNTSDLEKWQIDSSRKMRESYRFGQTAMLQAQELADRTEFGKLELSHPAIYRRYQAEVEQVLANARNQGQNAPRKMILYNLIGRDMVEGKIKPKAKAQAAAEPAPQVNRGRTPGVRSDVPRNASRSMTEREKRKARLENVII